MGWTYAFPNLCEPERFHGSYLSGIAPGKTFNTNAIFENREVNERLYIEEVGVDLELVFMPMDTM